MNRNIKKANIITSLRVTIITDIHYGIDVRNKIGSKGARLMDKFTIAAQKSPSSVIVDMGDRISAKNARVIYILHIKLKNISTKSQNLSIIYGATMMLLLWISALPKKR